MNCYEHTLITRHDIQENQNKRIIEKYQNIINKNSGKVVKTEEWGLRNLSYEIKKNKKGYYIHIKFEGIGKTIQELENTENIDEMLIRFLTVKVKKHDLESSYFEKRESAITSEKK
jgi:small subunit ribosomal protein S6